MLKCKNRRSPKRRKIWLQKHNLFVVFNAHLLDRRKSLAFRRQFHRVDHIELSLHMKNIHVNFLQFLLPSWTSSRGSFNPLNSKGAITL